MDICPACYNKPNKCDCFTLKEVSKKLEHVKKHGYHGYTKHRCRCDVCVEAGKTLNKHYRNKKRQKENAEALNG